MTGGTRLLYENSTLGQIWRLYPWGLLAAVLLAIAGCVCMVKGYVKKADRKPKMRGTVNGVNTPYCIRCGCMLLCEQSAQNNGENESPVQE